MIRPIAVFISLSASLLLWTAQASGEPLTAAGEYGMPEQYRAQSSGPNFNVGHSSGLLQQIRTRMSSLGLNMPGRLGETRQESRQYGEAPSWEAETSAPVAQQAVPPILAIPANEPRPNPPLPNEHAPDELLPNGFIGSVVTLNTYHHPAPPQPVPYQPMPPMASGPYPQSHSQPAHGTVIPEQRIVYVPYASPPPIYVDRLGKALPRPVVRRVLGDANMYEYPEMPMRTYTTRGPRDFLAPNPPGIGY